MKRLVIFGAVAVAGATVVRRLARGCEGFSFERMIDRMPDDAPPKWMFRNISAIRENTDRLLEILEPERAEQSEAGTRTAA